MLSWSFTYGPNWPVSIRTLYTSCDTNGHVYLDGKKASLTKKKFEWGILMMIMFE
jgi:hypothetical protein